jgi:hypothetical protein
MDHNDRRGWFNLPAAIEKHQVFTQYVGERAKVDDAERRYGERQLQLRKQYDAARAQWREEAKVAQLAGALTPPEPLPPDGLVLPRAYRTIDGNTVWGAPPTAFDERRAEIGRLERQLFREHAGELAALLERKQQEEVDSAARYEEKAAPHRRRATDYGDALTDIQRGLVVRGTGKAVPTTTGNSRRIVGESRAAHAEAVLPSRDEQLSRLEAKHAPRSRKISPR